MLFSVTVTKAGNKSLYPDYITIFSSLRRNWLITFIASYLNWEKLGAWLLACMPVCGRVGGSVYLKVHEHIYTYICMCRYIVYYYFIFSLINDVFSVAKIA
jgi:hypothetical protein